MGIVDVLMKIPFEKIIEKYGIKVWNGDKVFGRLVQITDNHVIIIGTQSGIMKTIPKEVKIEKSDIKMVYNIPSYQIKPNIIWEEKEQKND